MFSEYSKNLATELGVCALIPTFNNERTLSEIITRCRDYISDIVVIDDGSTDHTAQILSELTAIECIHLPQNKGKGNALIIGLRKIAELGFQYAITLDSDGQHLPEDIPYLLAELVRNPGSIIIGSRNMYQTSVPLKSSFGNRFSNFWFRLYSGIALPDTQSGYRIYPVEVNALHLYSVKYELEVEIMVKAAWKGIPVIPIPVRVYYPPGDVRVSHFRPFRDFTRISILNTLLFFRAFFYEIPKRYFKNLAKTPFRTTLIKAFNDPQVSTHRKAAAIGFGVFMGIFPVWGYQLIIGWALCQVFRLNKVLFTVAAHISIPPMIPLIIFASYKVGAMVVSHPTHLVFDPAKITLMSIKNNIIQYAIGAVLLASVAGLLAYMGSWIFYTRTHRKNTL